MIFYAIIMLLTEALNEKIYQNT